MSSCEPVDALSLSASAGSAERSENRDRSHMSAAMTQEQPEAGPPISNFREAGGWLGRIRRRMTTGWLFRSAAPGALGRCNPK